MNVSPKDLRQVVVFQNATEADLRQILENSFPRSVEEGEYFFLQGDPANYLYVLLHGQVKLLQTNLRGQQVNLRTIYPWQMFGALGAVRDKINYPASAMAMENCAALAIKSLFLKDMLRTRPYLSIDLMHLVTDYVQEMQVRYRELATERVDQRIAGALLRLTAQSGQKTDKGVELSFSRQDVAEMSGTTLYTVSRVMTEWERRGWVRLGREQIQIIKPHELVKIAEGTER